MRSWRSKPIRTGLHREPEPSLTVVRRVTAHAAGVRAVAGGIRATLRRGRPVGRHHRRRDGRAHGAAPAGEDRRHPRRDADHLRRADSIGEATWRAASSSLGLQPQDRVVVQLPNCPEFVSLYLALNYIGVIPVMALRAHRHAEIRHFVRSSGAAAYFVADRVGSFDYRPMAAEIAAEFPSLRHVVVVGEPGPGQTAFRTLLSSAPPMKTCSRACGPIRRRSRRCCCRAGRRRCRS